MMKDKQKAPTFGELLRQSREKTFDKGTHKCLSQGQMGQKLYDKAGLIVSRNKVGKWELDQALIPLEYQIHVLNNVGTAKTVNDSQSCRTMAVEYS